MNLHRIPRQLKNRYVAGAAIAAALAASTVVVTTSSSDDGTAASPVISVGPDADVPSAGTADPAVDATTGGEPGSVETSRAGVGPSGTGDPAVDPRTDDEPPADPTVADDPADAVEDAHVADAGADPVVEPAGTTAPVARPEPTPDELEGPNGPGAGEVTDVGVTERPATDPPPAPTWAEVHLDPVEIPAPVEELAPAPPEPADVPPLGSGAPSDELVGNASGCRLQCISTALLSQPALRSDLLFDLTTDVETAATAWLLDSAPAMVGGVPNIGAWPHAMSGVHATQWSTRFEVAPDTTYHFVLRVEDHEGHERWAMTEWTTQPELPDVLVGDGDGCYYQCIEFGTVHPTDSYDRVDLVIGTNVGPHADVDFEVAVSAAEPSWIGEPAVPFLSPDKPFTIDQDGGDDVRGHVSWLEPETVYHVVVQATDEDGHTAYATGRFTTDPVPPPVPLDVKVGWERIFVHHDGDAGAWGRGELAFAWGLDAGWSNAPGTGLTSFGWRNEEKIGDGTSIDLGGHSHTWIEVFEGESLPYISVTAHENDTHGNIEYPVCRDLRQVTHPIQRYDSTCMTRVNVATEHDLTLDDIRALPSCADFGIADKSDHGCLVTKSHHANDQHAHFDAVLSFEIAD